MEVTVREIEPRDNAAVEAVIRGCLIEFGGNHEGTAWADPDLGRFSEIYDTEIRKYWVAVDGGGRVVAGVGIGELPGTDGVCELQKMYAVPEARGQGVAAKLMDVALAHAKKYFTSCYLETLENMTAAQRFYEKYGFERVDGPLGDTGHFNCDVRYLRKL